MLNKTLLSIGLLLLFAFAVFAQSGTDPCPDSTRIFRCRQQALYLAGTPITIKVYTKPKAGLDITALDRTFVVVHANEEKGLAAAKKVISENYGRLVEVVSNYQEGFKLNPGEISDRNQRRYLYFEGGKYCIDPNRIYSEKGREKAIKESPCDQVEKPGEVNKAIASFAENLLNIVTMNNSQRLIIGVHNNGPGDLSVDSWYLGGAEAKTAVGVVKSNNNGREIVSKDNFILVTNRTLFNSFFSPPFSYNIALQETREFLLDSNGEVKSGLDDGSMSIYFGSTPNKKTIYRFSYINIEALGKEDKNSPEDVRSKTWQIEVIKRALTLKS